MSRTGLTVLGAVDDRSDRLLVLAKDRLIAGCEVDSRENSLLDAWAVYQDVWE
jgi:hypothetical protein